MSSISFLARVCVNGIGGWKLWHVQRQHLNKAFLTVNPYTVLQGSYVEENILHYSYICANAASLHSIGGIQAANFSKVDIRFVDITANNLWVSINVSITAYNYRGELS